MLTVLHSFLFESNIFLKKYLNGVVAGSICFFVLLLLNLSYLSNPPYWDDILGLHNQAVWLARNNFNLTGLWQTGQSYLDGGSNIYRLGIMPYFYGVLYGILSVSDVHFTGHILNIACLALTFGCFYAVIRKYTSPYIALLWSVAALCEPVMAGRSAALGQECPLIAVSALAIYFISKRRFWVALIIILFTSLIKMTVILLLLTLGGWLVIVGLLGRFYLKKIVLDGNLVWKLIGTFAVGLIFVFEIRYLVGHEAESAYFSFDFLFPRMCFIFKKLVPGQIVILLLVITCGVAVCKRIIAKKTLKRTLFSLYLLLLVIFFWVAFLLLPVPLPRYTSFVVFPAYALLAISIRKKYCNILFSLMFILFGILMMDGKYHQELLPMQCRSGEYLERSREYLKDLKSNMVLCRTLEENVGVRPLVAKWPFVQMLTMPEMGYVKNPLTNVYVPSIIPKYTPALAYTPNMTMPKDTLYLFAGNSFESWRLFGSTLRPEKTDKLLWLDESHNGLLMVYEKCSR